MLGLVLLPLAFSSIFGFPKDGPNRLTLDEVKRVEEWQPEDLQNIWELSGQFEGDIVLRGDDDIVPNLTRRNGMIAIVKRWPNKELPYQLAAAFNYREKRMIHEAVKVFAQKTCVKVRPKRASDKDYVYVTDEKRGCSSEVGRQGGRQKLNLHRNSGCFRAGSIQHEFLHALGFFHQQSVTNRDNYVTILWNNIKEDHEHNFIKYDRNVVTDFGVGYDYGSLMHYSAYAFTANGKKSILTKDPNAKLGQRDAMSDKDVLKLNRMYKCK